jgi:hypothetical protein
MSNAQGHLSASDTKPTSPDAPNDRSGKVATPKDAARSSAGPDEAAGAGRRLPPSPPSPPSAPQYRRSLFRR